jgi:hypothetical protein
MKKLVMIGLAVLVMFGLTGNSFAAGKRGTAAEAEAMVKKAIAMAKAKGLDAPRSTTRRGSSRTGTSMCSYTT